MKTIYRSEVLNRNFETEEACLKAEKEYEEKHAKELALKEERAADAKVVEEAFKEAQKSYNDAKEKLNEFIKKHGSYHKTWSSETPSTKSFVDVFFDGFWL